MSNKSRYSAGMLYVAGLRWQTTELVPPSHLLPARTLTSPRHGWRKQWPLLSIALLLLVIGTLSVISLFVQRSLAPLRLGNQMWSRSISASQLQLGIAKATQAYRLQFTTPDGKSQSFSLMEAGLTVDASASAREALAERQTASLWQHLEWWHSTPIQLHVSEDKAKFDTFINQHTSQVVTPVQDAQLSINNGHAVLSAEKVGLNYSLPSAKTAIHEAAATLSTTPLKLQSTLVQPTYEAKKLEPAKQRLEAALTQSVSFQIADATITPSPSDLAGWLEISPVAADRNVDVTANSGKILEYINKVARPYVHPARSEIVVNHDDGSSAVLVKGQSGMDVVNKDKVASQVANKLLDGKGVKVDMTVDYAAYKTISAQPYDKWIEVDVSSKRLYAYEQTTVVNTQLVSAGAPATPTVLGQYQIYAKYRSQDMRGANADGSRYFQPDVEWVNYFYQDYAIHGNYWRPLSYFGNVNSSHGCVGLINSDAEWVYDWAPIGTPVIVHD